MKTRLARLGKLAATGCVLACLCGCAWSIGGGKREASTNHEPTRGQELIDLKKARDMGAINEQEYQAQKNRIMSK
jgi:hypothetical protein